MKPQPWLALEPSGPLLLEGGTLASYGHDPRQAIQPGCGWSSSPGGGGRVREGMRRGADGREVIDGPRDWAPCH